MIARTMTGKTTGKNFIFRISDQSQADSVERTNCILPRFFRRNIENRKSTVAHRSAAIGIDFLSRRISTRRLPAVAGEARQAQPVQQPAQQTDDALETPPASLAHVYCFAAYAVD